MPTKRRLEKTDDIAVPDISEDAAERKRALNVLAQRRYRKKKRERLAALEAQAKSSSCSRSNTALEENADQCIDARGQEESGLTTTSSPLPTNGNIQTIYPRSPEAILGLHEEPFVLLPNADEQGIDSNLLSSSNTDDLFLPGLTSGSSNSSNSPPLPNDLDSFFSLTAGSPPGPCLPFQFFANQASGTNPDIASTLQDHQSSTFTFPDDHLLDVPPLTLLRAALIIATRLGIAEIIWEFTCTSPFYTGSPSNTSQPSPSSSPTSTSTVPPNLPLHLHPTPTQRQLPHHPILDLLPWPTVRDKMIQVFSVPAHLRPPAAADPLALVNFVYDMEDPAEGMRVGGQDPFEAGEWEVGQVVFEKWWWAFDGKVVERSNLLRRQRGEKGLVLGVVG